MISFMVIAGERSASTWAANWLTTDTTLCIHDPLMRYALGDLDGLYPLMDKRKGISCTALQMAPAWVNAHPAKKVILHRPEEDIAASWHRLGVDGISRATTDRLNRIDGMHYSWTALFDPITARQIAEILGVPFDLHRHTELVQMNVQPHWAALSVTRRGVTELVERIRKTF